ncbi:hypothetical protein BH11PSE12_BH11PSE12_13350 [soil metagenome]
MSAIFLLVILSVLGVFMLSISTMQQTTSAQDSQGSRAYQAARAGIEWGTYQILNPENTNPATAPYNTQYACVSPAANPVAPAASLNNFVVKVVCTVNTYTESGNRISVYQIESTATFGSAKSPNYVERQLRASINTCRKAVNGASC